jgi:uncharacterized protein YwqG
MIDKRVIEAVRSAARNHDTPDEVAQMVIDRLLPSIRLEVQPVDATPPLGTSRIGGCPDLPNGVKWPRRADAAGDEPEDWGDGNNPFRFVMQVNLAEVAPFDVGNVLPKAGLLSYFYFNDPDQWPGDIAHVIQSETKNLRRLRWPRDLPKNRRYRPLLLKPRLEWTVPSIEDAGFESEAVDSDFPYFDFFEAVVEKVSEAQGISNPRDGSEVVHRLLGHPQLIQSPGLADGTRLLLQVDSDPPGFRGADLPRTGMTWGDCGRIFYLIGDNELKSQRLAEKPWVLWEG